MRASWLRNSNFFPRCLFVDIGPKCIKEAAGASVRGYQLILGLLILGMASFGLMNISRAEIHDSRPLLVLVVSMSHPFYHGRTQPRIILITSVALRSGGIPLFCQASPLSDYEQGQSLKINKI